MKLKPLVVASMSMLSMSLISYPVFAADTTDTTQMETQAQAQPQAAQAEVKVRHKKIHRHHVAAQKRDVVALAQPAPVVSVVPQVDGYAVMMDSMTQNLGRQVRPTADWFNRIGVIGGINTDFHWFNRHMGYMGENSRRISLNDAYINVSAVVNDWTKAFASLSYNNATSISTNGSEVLNFTRPGIYSAAYSNNNVNFTNNNDNSVQLEQGYITFGNFACSPFFVQLGKQFQDFGRYQIHPIERTMAQVLSESLATSAKIGFLTPIGLHGSVYAFDDNLRIASQSNSKTVWGGALGWDMPSDQLGWDLGVGYMSSMTGVNDVAYAISAQEAIFTAAGIASSPIGSYQGTVGAWNAYGDVNSGPFGLSARYTSAAHAYSPLTLSNNLTTSGASGARPWAADITAGYGFNAWCKNQNVYVGYQFSGNAAAVYLPKNRWIAGYGIDVWKNATLSAEYGHDQDYSSGNGGTGNASNTLGARAAVKFG
jgi:hypothetical protein